MQGLCLPCPAGTYCHSRIANESEQACVQCPADHYCPADAVLPSPCPHGVLARLLQARPLPVSAGRGRATAPAHAPDELSNTNPCRLLCSKRECKASQALKNTSALAAISLRNCTCVPGHGVLPQHNLADPCSPCADGFFALGGGGGTHCGWGAVKEPPSAASSATASATRC